MNRLAAGNHYFECDRGINLNYGDIKNLLSLHNIWEIKRAVSQEISWFNSPKLTPKDICIYPTIVDSFKNMIWNYPAYLDIPSKDMNPNTMAQLCCKRLLTSDHLLYIIKRLNEKQDSCHIIYGNYVKNVADYLSKINGNDSRLERIIIMANVGNSEGTTFMGSETREGNHWSFVFYDNATSEITYCDSLGWNAPSSLIEMIKYVIKHLFGVDANIRENHCHNPISHRNNRSCSDDCRQNYPLQTCGNICGIVAIIMTAVVTLRPNFFHSMMSSNENVYFMRDPTKYCGYLRLVLCSWYGNGEVEIGNVIPTNYGNEESSLINSESDEVKIIDTINNATKDEFSTEAQKQHASNATNGFVCPGCSQTFTKKANMRRHIKNKHSRSLLTKVSSGNCMCLECSFRCHRIVELRDHLAEKHNFTIESEVLEFDNFKEFDDWKTEYEETNKCQYLVKSGVFSNKAHEKVTYYQCNRSGVYKCMGNKQRRTKEIAAKLHLGVSSDKILDDVRDNIGADCQRIHLIEKQDIDNLARSFGVSSVQRHHNDQDSVSAWISEWKSKEHCPILFHKFQGESSDQFKREDFVIIIQTDFQRSLLGKFGPNGICGDSTHGTNMYDFVLTTMMVIDDFGKGQPVAWLLSNHESFEFLKVFFTKIRDVCGLIEPVWIMTDLANQFYDAYCKVNSCLPKKLWCSWHFVKAWQEELRKKIGDKMLEKEVYDKLHFLRDLTDCNVFDDYLHDFCVSLKNSSKTKSFGEYFEVYWAPKKKFWAYCFRIGVGINTNMYIEAFHRVLKYNYLRGKHNRRVDVCLFTLLKYNRDRVYERVIDQTKKKVTHKQGMIFDRHKASESMSEVLVTQTDNGLWCVKSEQHDVFYNVTRSNDSCKENCNFKCTECSVCSHVFSCTCMDYLTKNIPCKHIHLVGKVTDSINLKDHVNLIDDNLNSSDSPNLEESLKVLRCTNPPNVEQLKGKISTNLMNIMELMKRSYNEDALKTLNKQILAASNTFSALLETKHESLDVFDPVNSRKSIVRQDRFFSTKRKRKNLNVRLAKPTLKEKQRLLERSNWKGFSEVSSVHDVSCKQSSEDDSIKMNKVPLVMSKEQRKLLSYFGVRKWNGQPLQLDNLTLGDGNPPGDVVNYSMEDMEGIKSFFQPNAWKHVLKAVIHVNTIWKCPECDTPKFKDMIECEHCEVWFHWECVSDAVMPSGDESWCCRNCRIGLPNA